MSAEADAHRRGSAESSTAGGCLACRCRCTKSELRFSVLGRFSRNVSRIEEALDRGGFEVHARIGLADLAQERLGVETPPLTLLYLTHPVLLLQSLFMGGEPSLFLPLLAILRPTNESTEVCITHAWSQADPTKSALPEQLVAQMRERLFATVAPLRDTA